MIKKNSPNQKFSRPTLIYVQFKSNLQIFANHIVPNDHIQIGPLLLDIIDYFRHVSTNETLFKN